MRPAMRRPSALDLLPALAAVFLLSCQASTSPAGGAAPGASPSAAATATVTASEAASPVTTGGDGPPKAIYAYLEARVAGDANRMVTLSCATWEGQAKIEAASFRNVKPRLEDAVCETAGTEGEFTLVACQGRIMTSYNGEPRAFDLSHRQFKTVNDGGEWRMCGYK